MEGATANQPKKPVQKWTTEFGGYSAGRGRIEGRALHQDHVEPRQELFSHIQNPGSLERGLDGGEVSMTLKTCLGSFPSCKTISSHKGLLVTTCMVGTRRKASTSLFNYKRNVHTWQRNQNHIDTVVMNRIPPPPPAPLPPSRKTCIHTLQ